jgi:hypothetical protein
MSDLLNEALDERRELRREVERLRELLRIARAMRDTAGAQREDAWREVRRLRIKNARLRKALNAFVEADSWLYMPAHLLDRARAALGEGARDE